MQYLLTTTEIELIYFAGMLDGARKINNQPYSTFKERFDEVIKIEHTEAPQLTQPETK
jgi:hypothetical protein